MKYIICNKINELKEGKTHDPYKKSGEAIVRIRRIGICGTDLHAFEGTQPYFNYPRILGHELAGEIEWIDPSIDSFKIGDRVTIIPYLECGKCIACRNNKSNCCTDMKVLGVHVDGGMQEKISIPIDHMIKMNEFTFDQTAIIEPLSIGAHAVHRAKIKKNEFVLVIGGGPIGLGVMLFAKQQGAKVIGMDINNHRLEHCKQWAKTDYIVHALHSPIEELSRITKGDMPTVVIDATGNKKSMEDSFSYVAHGGKVVFVGLTQDKICFSNPLYHGKELTLLSSRNANKYDFNYVIQMMAKGIIDTNKYITNRIEFNQTVTQFGELLEPESKIIKAIIDI